MRPLQVDAVGWVTAGPKKDPVRLVGVNVDTYIFEDGRVPPPWFVGSKDFEDLAKWGMNSFRLNMDYRWFISKKLDQVNPKGWEYLDWVVSEAERNRLYVILDMHIPVGGMQVGGHVTKLWTDEKLQQVFIDLWKQIADRYKNSPAIAGYYLIGEPTPKKRAQWQTLAQATYDAIREVSPDQVVIVEAPNSGDGDLAQLKPLNGTNIMYSWQYYEPFPFTHQGASWEEPGGLQADDVTYPGTIIEDFKTLGSASLPVQAPTPTWQQLVTGPMVPPADATHLTVALHVSGGQGEVDFDDVTILENGKPIDMLDPGFEDAKLINERGDKLPDYWHAKGNKKSVKWVAGEDAHGGQHYIAFQDSAGAATLRQASGSATGLYPVKPGATYVVGVWVRGGRANLLPEKSKKGEELPGFEGVQIGWAHAETAYWGPQELERAVYDNLMAWSQKYQVPVYVPEFAASAAAPGRSDLIWTRDVLAAFDKYGLSWHLWDFRDIRGPDENILHIMGLYDGPEGSDSSQCTLDTKLLDVLKPAMKRANQTE